VINIIKGLFHKASAQFTLDKDTLLRLLKGVRQGCPLSCLLFLICMHPLLTKLAQTPRILPHSFVDDITLGLPNHTALLTILPAVDDFTAHSGLHMNEHKTTIITAQDHPELRFWIRRRLTGAWQNLQHADEIKSLGYRVGADVTPTEIWAKPIEKFCARLTAATPLLRRSNTHTRHTIYNQFLYPILSYHLNIYPPVDVDLDHNQATATSTHVINQTARSLISYTGTAHTYVMLIQPNTKGFSCASPIRDFWASAWAHQIGKLTNAELQDLADNGPAPDATHISMRPSRVRLEAARVLHRAHLFVHPTTPFTTDLYHKPIATAQRNSAYELLATYHTKCPTGSQPSPATIAARRRRGCSRARA